MAAITAVSSAKELRREQKKNCFFIYELSITSKAPCSNSTIGKIKYNLNLQELMERPDCYHNEAAYARKLERDNWSNNYSSPQSRKIFDCHFIEYVENCDSIDFDIKILFFSLKAGEFLIPSVIKSDNQIISIIKLAIMYLNNITMPIFHNYQIELLCQAIANNALLDLRYVGHPACKTDLYMYQRDSIQWAINLENELPRVIGFCEDKLLFLEELGLVFNYNLSNGSEDKCFFKINDIPKAKVYGGIIADEVGLGKTVQALNLALSRYDIRTLIIVPNHIKDHWLSEMKKHFNGNPFEGLVLVVTVAEATQMSNEIIGEFQRLIVDELSELYANARTENHKLFARLCECNNFKYRWGITATPFVDDKAMLNIIKFLLCRNRITFEPVGRYIWIQEQFKPFFRKNIKANVQQDVKLPDVIIHNHGLDFSEYERAILTAMLLDKTSFSIDDILRVISNAMLEFSNNDKSVITVEELKQLTVQRFKEKIDSAQANLKDLQTKLLNIQEHTKQISCDVFPDWFSERIQFYKKDPSRILAEYQERERHLETEIETARCILARRIQVHDSYLEMTKNIADIIQSASDSDNEACGDGDCMTQMDVDEMINENKMCPICYGPFSGNIVLFVKCRHYFCQGCFERCHKNQPNTCPMCRSKPEVGEIMYLGLKTQVITSTKNTEILRLLNTHPEDRFLIFTRFDSFITPLTSFLSMNDIAARTFDDFKSVVPEAQNATRVIILSANSNASGTDMTFMNRIIIIEPFENYIYGKEIEKQVIGRLHRINQTHIVNVHRLYIKNTIEEQIYYQ